MSMVTTLNLKNNLQSLPKNEYTSYILGGVVVDTIGDPITFALEIVNTDVMRQWGREGHTSGLK